VIENYNKALGLVSEKTRPSIYNKLGDVYCFIGFIEKARYYYKEACTLNKDSASYYSKMALIEAALGNPEEAYRMQKIAYELNTGNLFMCLYFSEFSGHNDEAFQYATKMVESGKFYASSTQRIGYAFWHAGKKKEAEGYIYQQIKFREEEIKKSRISPMVKKRALYGLAVCCSFLNEKEKAYQYLDEFTAINFNSAEHRVMYIYDPMLDNLRNEERFKKILQVLEAQYQAEHERVKKWLEENNML
jgi:tetratricopeptide (TPR) repeat protein